MEQQSNDEIYYINKNILSEIASQKDLTLIFFHQPNCYQYDLHHDIVDEFKDNENIQILYIGMLDYSEYFEFKEFAEYQKFDEKVFLVKDEDVISMSSWNNSRDLRLRQRKYFVDIWGDSTQFLKKWTHPQSSPQIVLTNKSLDCLFEETSIIPQDGYDKKLKNILKSIKSNFTIK